MSTNQPSAKIPLLPALDAESLKDPSVPNIPIGETVPLDHLGPMVVNNDGTLSRIANWENITEEERERTLRVVVARNGARLAKLKRDIADASSAPLSASL